jgi:hypothetical protein
MSKTIARHKKEIAMALNKLPDIFRDVGIDCIITIDTNGSFLSLTMYVKMKDAPSGIALTRDYVNRTPLVEFWKNITSTIVMSLVGISKLTLSSAVSPAAIRNCFFLKIYHPTEAKILSWIVYPKPDCIEVEDTSYEEEVRKDVLSWEEYLRRLIYTIRLVMEVKDNG